MSKKIDLLTPLELKVMNVLWKLKKAFVKEVLEHWQLDEKEVKKPAYNTVSTIIRLLDTDNKNGKGYVSHETFGRTHRYYPIVSKADYQKRLLENVVQNVFSGSVSSLVSALVDTEEVSNDELEAIQQLINDNLDG